MSIAPVTAAAPTSVAERDAELRTTFQMAVAGTMFAQMLKSLRSTVGKPAYLHGGQAEDMFQSQLDQELVAQLSQTNGSAYVEGLYRQFRIQLGLPPEDAVSSASETASIPAPSPPSSGERVGVRGRALLGTSEDKAVDGDRSERSSPSPYPSPPKTGERGPNSADLGSRSWASSLSVQPSATDRLAELTESAQQARMAAERTAGTTGTAALSAMFRK
ncbi:MAG: rod-binding protein [Planctomycetaceae bacterium]|nr:rod-binding protein [Planctomycetaceae bacterium]